MGLLILKKPLRTDWNWSFWSSVIYCVLQASHTFLNYLFLNTHLSLYPLSFICMAYIIHLSWYSLLLNL